MYILPWERNFFRIKVYILHLSNPELDKYLIVWKKRLIKTIQVIDFKNIHFALGAKLFRFKVYILHLSNPELDKYLIVWKKRFIKSIRAIDFKNVHFALGATFVPLQGVHFSLI